VVDEGDGHLNQALKEQLFFRRSGPPDIFENLVSLIELAAIEERNTVMECGLIQGDVIPDEESVGGMIRMPGRMRLLPGNCGIADRGSAQVAGHSIFPNSSYISK
jgi:hypothetical protein